MHLRYVTRSWVASALWLLALHLPRAPSAGWAEASFQGKGRPPRKGFPPEFWAACNLARKLYGVKSCYCKVTCAWPLRPHTVPLLRCLPSLWPPSRETSHPGYLRSHCCRSTPPERRACQALARVRRLLLRHCGRQDWEVHSVLFQPHLACLLRAAQVEV